MTPSQLLTAAELDRQRLRHLSQIEDEAGVLTITAGHDPARPDEARAARTAVHSGLRAWRRSDDGEFVKRLANRVEQLDEEIARLVDPATKGRGRLLVTSLALDAPVEVVRIQQPLPHEVVIARHAWIRPLVDVWARSQPVRVIGLHHGGVRVFDWALGEAVHRWDREVEFGDRHLADVKSGPSGPSTSPQRGHVDRESFEDRLDANRERMLRSAVEDAVDSARQLGHRRVLLMGPSRLQNAVRPELQHEGLELWSEDHDVTRLDASGVRDVVERHVQEAFARREDDLVERINAAVEAGGAGVTGLAGVLSALNEGRVDTLVVATGTTADGYLLPDGRLSLHDRGGEPQPYLLDRAIAAGLMTDAEVVPVDHELADRLGGEGIGALLRW